MDFQNSNPNDPDSASVSINPKISSDQNNNSTVVDSVTTFQQEVPITPTNSMPAQFPEPPASSTMPMNSPNINPPEDPSLVSPLETEATPVITEPSASIGASLSQSQYQGQGMGKYKVVVIPEKCIGAASCVAVAAKAFQLNDQQIAEVLTTVNQESDDNLLLAAQSCPTLAIEVYDTTTGEKVWPK